MNGIIVKDWTKVKYDPKTGLPTSEDHKKIMGCLRNYLKAPKVFQKAFRNVKLQEFATTEDFPASVLQVIEKFHITNMFDTAYQQIFDIRDYTGSDRNGFDILDVESGLTFQKTKEGEKIDVYAMKGAKTRIYFNYYGGALGWHRRLFEDKEYWQLEDNAITFRNKSMEKEASAYYELIENIDAGRNISWQVPDPSTLPNTDATYTANRDAQTLNAAANDIIDKIKGKGYGININTQTFVILAPYQLKGRLRKALTVVLQSYKESEKQVNWNFVLLTTTMLTSATSYYVCVPKIKAKGGTRMNLKIFGQFDALSYTDISAGWMRFGAGIGDQEQFARCATL